MSSHNEPWLPPHESDVSLITVLRASQAWWAAGCWANATGRSAGQHRLTQWSSVNGILRLGYPC